MTDTAPPVTPCTCQACSYGLYCSDGERGKFVRGEDDCKRPECRRLAFDHSTKPTRCVKR